MRMAFELTWLTMTLIDDGEKNSEADLDFERAIRRERRRSRRLTAKRIVVSENRNERHRSLQQTFKVHLCVKLCRQFPPTLFIIQPENFVFFLRTEFFSDSFRSTWKNSLIIGWWITERRRRTGIKSLF